MDALWLAISMSVSVNTLVAGFLFGRVWGRNNTMAKLVEYYTGGALWKCERICALNGESDSPLLITLDRGSYERITVRCNQNCGIKVTNYVLLRLRNISDGHIVTNCEPFGDMFIPELYKLHKPGQEAA
ncbi:MAG: hypothetical protein NT108_02360 [Candidatus Kaiserbacteria bacterium]|nr:hypothetical protein [Candidatus Kaiserbacteria bacterium]